MSRMPIIYWGLPTLISSSGGAPSMSLSWHAKGDPTGTLAEAIWALTMTFSIARMGWSTGIGSGANTSRAAAETRPALEGRDP